MVIVTYKGYVTYIFIEHRKFAYQSAIIPFPFIDARKKHVYFFLNHSHAHIFCCLDNIFMQIQKYSYPIYCEMFPLADKRMKMGKIINKIILIDKI